MSRVIDFYEILGVRPNSDEVVIQGAYRALMRKYHPDTNKSSDATAKCAKINEAYATLSEPNRRSQYDRTLAEARSKSAGKKQNPPPPPPPIATATATATAKREADCGFGWSTKVHKKK